MVMFHHHFKLLSYWGYFTNKVARRNINPDEDELEYYCFCRPTTYHFTKFSELVGDSCAKSHLIKNHYHSLNIICR